MKYIHYRKILVGGTIVGLSLFLLATLAYAQYGAAPARTTLDSGMAANKGLDLDSDGGGTKDGVEDSKRFVACTADAKVCPDGSAVGRVGPACEFAACPGEANGAFDDGGAIKVPVQGDQNIDAFLKFGEIKGEAKDDAGGGAPGASERADFTLSPDRVEGVVGQNRLDEDDDGDSIGDDETTGKSSKPQEIVVVGSKARDEAAKGVAVRGWDPEKKEVTTKPEDVVTEKDLTDYANALLVSNADVLSFQWDSDRVSISYNQPVKLFGFFPVIMRQRVDVTASSVGTEDRVRVRFPWWSFLVKKSISSNEIKSTVEEELGKNSEETDAGDASSEPAQQESRKFQILSNIMKASHDAAMNSIRNIR